MVASLPKHIEICSRSPKLTIQRINIQSTKHIVKGPHCYIASTTHVWRLVPVSLEKQIQQLIGEKQFEMALTLAVSANMKDILFFNRRPFPKWPRASAKGKQSQNVYELDIMLL